MKLRLIRQSCGLLNVCKRLKWLTSYTLADANTAGPRISGYVGRESEINGGGRAPKIEVHL